jgi:hypothetical protein
MRPWLPAVPLLGRRAEPMTIPNLDELNLDCMTPDDLERVARALDLLARYACDKLEAMRYRARGEICAAVLLERRCDGYFVQLPPDWRW